MDDKKVINEGKKNAGSQTAHIVGKGLSKTIPGASQISNGLSKTKLGQAVKKNIGNQIVRPPVSNNPNDELNKPGINDNPSSKVDDNSSQALPQNGNNSQQNSGLSQNGESRSNRTPTQNARMKRPTGNHPSARDNNANIGVPKKNTSSTKTPPALSVNKQKSGGLNRFFNRKKQVQSTSDATDTDDSTSTEESSSNEESTFDETRKKIAYTRKLILAIGAICGPIIAIILIIMIAVIIPELALSSAKSLFTHKTEDPEYVTSVDDTEARKAEIDYNNAIDGSKDGSVKGIVQEYQEKYNVTIDKLLLHAVLDYRYVSVSSDSDVYSDDGAEDLSDDELNEKLDELGSGETSEDSSSSGIDYSAASKKIKTVAALMVTKNGDGTYSTDTSVGGTFYNALIESDFLTSYYKESLVDTTYESRKKLVDEIFDYYELEKERLYDSYGGNFISDSMQIHLQTCETPYNTETNERGNTVFSNRRNINAGTSYPEFFSLTDYLKGAVEGEVGRGSLNEAEKEGVKAFVVATLTYMLGSFYVDFYPNVESINFPTGNCRLVSCDVKNGCTYNETLYKYGTAFSGLGRYSGGKHKPWNEQQNAFMDEILDEIFGYVMVKKGVTASTFKDGNDLKGGNYYDTLALCREEGYNDNCMGQKDALADSRNGMTYEQILEKYYSNYDIINIKEGIYVEDANYGNGTFNGDLIYYSQKDYKQSFCGRNNATIYSSGCGITSTAIVISSLTGDKQYDPLYFNSMAKSVGACGYDISGTATSFFKTAADRFNFGYEHVSKNNGARVVEILKQGNALVIAHMGPGTFTRGGHYVVLNAVNDKGQVHVVDPYGNAHTGWFSMNDVVAKESSSGFYAIIKR